MSNHATSLTAEQRRERYARTHGEPQEIPKEPSASKRADGAVILGADGKPA